MGTVAELGLVTNARIREGKKSKLIFKREICTNTATSEILKGKGTDASQGSWESSGHGSEAAVTAVVTELVADGSSAAELVPGAAGLTLSPGWAGRRCHTLGLRADADAYRLSLRAH